MIFKYIPNTIARDRSPISSTYSCFYILVCTVLLLLVVPFSSAAKDLQTNKLVWDQITTLPAATDKDMHPGLIAPFCGVSNNMLLVAGGYNYPESSKLDSLIEFYHDDAYALEKTSDGKYVWHSGFEIPYKVANGVSITTPKGVLCIGGINAESSFSIVFLMKWNPVIKQIETHSLPSLPFPLSKMAGALVGNKIYISGGYKNGQLSNSFLCLDINNWNDNQLQWELLENLPGLPRIDAIAVGQNSAEEGHLYLFGGAIDQADVTNPDSCAYALEYNPRTKAWIKIPDVTSGMANSNSLFGGTGLAIGAHHIIVKGGNILRDLQQKPDSSTLNEKIWVYHTITQEWMAIQDFPYQNLAHSSLIEWSGGFAVVGGINEDGITSPEIYFGNTQYSPRFGWVNWMVIMIYLLGMVFLGYYFMRREAGTDTFFKGGQRIPWWAAGMSIFATMLSAVTYMAIPAKTYATDWKYFIMAITIFVMVWPVIRYYLPFYRRLNVTTAYEYLEKRFNYAARLLSTFIFQVFMIARMALVLFLPSLALTTVTGIDIYLCIILMGVITIIYCTMGGVEAVIWGDVIQGFVLLGGAILAVIFMVSGTDGGLNRVIEVTIAHEKMKMFDFAIDLTKATFWVVLLGGLANNLISYSSDQTVIQRYLTTKDEKSAGKGLWFNGAMSIIISLIFYFIGTALFALYKTQPQELNIAMANPDSIFPHFIMTRMPIGIAGVMIAAIFSATMSTVSSNVNSISTAFTVDIYNHFWTGSSDSKKLKVARLAGIISGALGILLALLMATWNILSLFDYFNVILGLLVGGLGGVFAMAIFFPRINSAGAIAGFILSFITLLIIKIYTPISFLLYGFLGIFISISIGLVVSLFTGKEQRDITKLTYKALR